MQQAIASLVRPALEALSVQQARKAQPERWASEARPYWVPLAQPAVPAQQANGVKPDWQARKAPLLRVSSAPLAVAAPQVRQAQSDRGVKQGQSL